MSERFKIIVKNQSRSDTARKYRVFSKLPKILHGHDNSSVGAHDIFLPCCYLTQPIGNGRQDSFEYTGQYFGFIGILKKKGTHISFVGSFEVTLGTNSDDGTCLIAKTDNEGALTIESVPSTAQNKAPSGSFQIHCQSKVTDENVVVGLARYFEPDDNDDPCPAAAVKYKWGTKYIITPSPTVCITTNGSGKGDIVPNLKNPFEIKYASTKFDTILVNDSNGEFSYLSKHRPSSDPSSSSGTSTRPNEPSSESYGPEQKDTSSQKPKQKSHFNSQLPPRAKAKGLETLEQLFAYNFLSRFNKARLNYYKDEDLIGIAKKTEGWFEQIRKVEGLNAEVLASLLLLSLYDCVLLLDDSSSMKWGQGKDYRKDQMRYICKLLIDVDTIFTNVDNLFADTKGVQVEFINAETSKFIKTPAEFQSHFEKIKFDGTTNLGNALLSKILEPRIYNAKSADGRRKPLLISIITDGEPYPERRDKLKEEVKRCKEFLKKDPKLGDKTVVFQISKVGSEAAAEEFIDEIENDQDLKNIVDCTSYVDIDPPPDYKPKIEKHATAIKLLAGAILVDFDQYQDDDWKDVSIE